MASVIMPYQMNMAATNQEHCATNSGTMMADINQDSEQDMTMSCVEECDCCAGICSLSYISSSSLPTGTKPIQESPQVIENNVIATTKTLFRPPIVG